jgi:NitT/TauT family transport system ATP-binding protein
MLRLEFRNLTMRFVKAGAREPVTALDEVSFAVADGEIVSLIGPSGCGKSTLLNIAAGLAVPTGGEAFVDGEPILGPNSHIAFMLQKDLLLPWRSIVENVMLGMEIRKSDPSQARRTAHALLRSFGLADFEAHYPHQLSGGMRQRAALARTLAVDPSVLLLDEPFSAVDAQTRIVLQQELARTLKQARKTALLITHDLIEAVILSDRVLVMSARPGRIIDEIAVEIGERDNPIARRSDPKVAPYVAQLMDRLGIGRTGDEPAREPMRESANASPKVSA